MRGRLVTTATVHVIDHKHISTTDKDSFHGTDIRIIQHPTTVSEGGRRGSVALGGDTSSKTDGQLPHYYIDVLPVAYSIKESPAPASCFTSLISLNKMYRTRGSGGWRTQDELLTTQLKKTGKYTSGCIPRKAAVTWRWNNLTPALLPPFHHIAQTVATIRHSMDVVKNAVDHLNKGHTTVYALIGYYIISLNRSSERGKDQIVVVFGGLHAEMTRGERGNKEREGESEKGRERGEKERVRERRGIEMERGGERGQREGEGEGGR